MENIQYTIPAYTRCVPKPPKPDMGDVMQRREFRLFGLHLLTAASLQMAYDSFALIVRNSPQFRDRRIYASDVLHRFSQMLREYSRDLPVDERLEYDTAVGDLLEVCEPYSERIFLALRAECAGKIATANVGIAARVFHIRTMLDLADIGYRGVFGRRSKRIARIRKSLEDFFGDKECGGEEGCSIDPAAALGDIKAYCDAITGWLKGGGR